MVLNSGGKKRREEKNKVPKIVATFVYASSQGQHTHSAWTNVPKIEAWTKIAFLQLKWKTSNNQDLSEQMCSIPLYGLMNDLYGPVSDIDHL